MRIWWWAVPNCSATMSEIFEFVDLLAAGGLETDGEGRQAVLAGLGEQSNDQAGSPVRQTAGIPPARPQPAVA